MNILSFCVWPFCIFCICFSLLSDSGLTSPPKREPGSEKSEKKTLPSMWKNTHQKKTSIFPMLIGFCCNLCFIVFGCQQGTTHTLTIEIKEGGRRQQGAAAPPLGGTCMTESCANLCRFCNLDGPTCHRRPIPKKHIKIKEETLLEQEHNFSSKNGKPDLKWDPKI